MFFTTGENADVIGSVPCSLGSDGAWHLHNHGMHTTRHDPISHQPPQNGCTTSPPLGHPIVQVCKPHLWTDFCTETMSSGLETAKDVTFLSMHFNI